MLSLLIDGVSEDLMKIYCANRTESLTRATYEVSGMRLSAHTYFDYIIFIMGIHSMNKRID